MRKRTLAALALMVVLLGTSTSFAETRHPDSTNSNPIRLEGQIREITFDGGGAIVRLHRQRHPVVMDGVTRVRWLNGDRARVADLQTGDSIRVEGNQERDHIAADRVTILLRVRRAGE